MSNDELLKIVRKRMEQVSTGEMEDVMPEPLPPPTPDEAAETAKEMELFNSGNWNRG